MLDPQSLNFMELTGKERVGVKNRNTGEKVTIATNSYQPTLQHRFTMSTPVPLYQLPLKQSPTLKTLLNWLQGHPHYNVDAKWGPLVLEWVCDCLFTLSYRVRSDCQMILCTKTYMCASVQCKGHIYTEKASGQPRIVAATSILGPI